MKKTTNDAVHKGEATDEGKQSKKQKSNVSKKTCNTKKIIKEVKKDTKESVDTKQNTSIKARKASTKSAAQKIVSNKTSCKKEGMLEVVASSDGVEHAQDLDIEKIPAKNSNEKLKQEVLETDFITLDTVVAEKPKNISKKEKIQHYESRSLDECIACLQDIHVQYDYQAYCQLLLNEEDLEVIEKKIVEENHINLATISFETHGYDKDLVMVTLRKVSDTMDIKASDFKDIKRQIKKVIACTYTKDIQDYKDQYLLEFSLSEKLLMIGQRKQLTTASEVSMLLGVDVTEYFIHFFDSAYRTLKNWQYNDVTFYEDFAYAILSQYTDVYESEQLRVQLDVADLYILHNDTVHGDDIYQYNLRENQIKDYIYYRYASIYKGLDRHKVQEILHEAFQFVDTRFTYYEQLRACSNG